MEECPEVPRNHEALKRIFAGILVMARIAAGPSTLPRHLYSAVLRMLRPTESATRRLIITVASYLPSLPFREAPFHKPALPARVVIGMHAGVKSRFVWKPGAQFPSITPIPARVKPARLAFPLLDPRRRPPGKRRFPATPVPCISAFGDGARSFRSRRPRRDDAIDVARLGLRIAALGRALDDLPGHARRFQRWRARNSAVRAVIVGVASTGETIRRVSRSWPLRRGRAPGGRLEEYDPDAKPGRNIREIDQVLAHCAMLADHRLRLLDTS